MLHLRPLPLPLPPKNLGKIIQEKFLKIFLGPPPKVTQEVAPEGTPQNSRSSELKNMGSPSMEVTPEVALEGTPNNSGSSELQNSPIGTVGHLMAKFGTIVPPPPFPLPDSRTSGGKIWNYS